MFEPWTLSCPRTAVATCLPASLDPLDFGDTAGAEPRDPPVFRLEYHTPQGVSRRGGSDGEILGAGNVLVWRRRHARRVRVGDFGRAVSHRHARVGPDAGAVDVDARDLPASEHHRHPRGRAARANVTTLSGG